MAQSIRACVQRPARHTTPTNRLHAAHRTFGPVDRRKPSPGGKRCGLVIGNGAAKAIDHGLVSLIARALATRSMLLAGRDDSIDAMAERLGVRRDYLAVLVRLSYLSPEIIRAILLGRQPIELTPARLVALSRNLPHEWQEQRRLLGFPSA